MYFFKNLPLDHGGIHSASDVVRKKHTRHGNLPCGLQFARTHFALHIDNFPD